MKREILKQLLEEHQELKNNFENISIKNNQICLFNRKINVSKDIEKKIKEHFDKDEEIINKDLYKIFCNKIDKIKLDFPKIEFQHNAILFLNSFQF